MQSRPTLSPLARALYLRRSLSLGLPAAVMVSALGTSLAAQAQSQTYEFSIGAQSLASALMQLADQTGLQVLYSPDTLGNLSTPGVRGRLSVDQAVRQLLGGTQLHYTLDGGTLTVLGQDSAGAMTLDASVVSSTRVNDSPWGETKGYVARRTATGTKTDTSMLENPQAISVVTRERMDDMGVQRLDEALRYTSGVRSDSGGANNAADNIYLRGYAISFTYRDGLRLRPLGFFGMFSEEPYGMERVEVLKGPTSILYGQADPGGMVNSISKRPTDYDRGEIGVSAGTGHRRQAKFDVSGALDDEKTLMYRLVGLGREADGLYDHTDDDRGYIAPSFTWRPNDQTSLTVLASYQKNKALAPTTIPWAAVNGSSPYGKVPMDRFVGEPSFDFEEVESTSLGYEFSHEFNDTWTVRQNVRWSDFDNQENYLARSFGLSSTGLITGPDGVPGASINRQWQIRHAYGSHLALDNQLQASFDTGPISHTALFGIDYSWSKSVRNERWGNATPINVFDPVYGSPVDTSVNASWVNNLQRSTQVGYYFQDQLKWDRWVLTVGGREDRARTQTEDRFTDIETADQHWRDFTGRAGLVYLFDNGFAPYVSYSESFNPVVGTTGPARGSKPFEPETAKQYEVGVRYQPPGTDTQITLSVYDLTKQNAVTTDPQDLFNSIQTGEIRSKGVELEAITTVMDDLKLTGSLSYSDVKVTKSNDGNEDKRPFKAPAKLASLWADYAIPFDPLQGLSVGMGVRYTGWTFGDSMNTFKVPSYTLYDAAVRYDLGKLDPSLRGAQAAINVNNLTDKYYVASCFFYQACNLGEGRSVIAELTYKW
ncbi:TonB-dependent siderophore receptor [Pseudomonas sp. zfem004]|uniref:TonB-dependent siderophore receptor n=1 Tax=unclassified Pseudomonas TaxID=196821 RepID=UPI00129A15C1|nr:MULTISPECIES: TonB-dependent siderophore receptor [unclassified Pseudomonas]MDU9405658.1 TonB-dependent siderophore receptor [Pseudomonas sp. zfem004]